MIDTNDKVFLGDLFRAAVSAADPVRILPKILPKILPEILPTAAPASLAPSAAATGRVVVIGAGKGAAQLAQAFEKNVNYPVQGVVVTRYGYGCSCENITILEAAHPVPDAAGLAAAKALLAAVSGLGPDDLVVALITGGGSALLPLPPKGFSLSDEQALNRILLESGAPIGVMNSIRKHFSDIKGGRLAAAVGPAKLISLVVSDVPGDAPEQVASGPTIPDAGGRAMALAAIKAHGIDLPPAIMDHIGTHPAPKPTDAQFSGHRAHVIASANLSLEAAASAAHMPVVILSDRIEGEAREVAKMHGAMAWEIRQRARPFKPPVLMLSGGETTVTFAKGADAGGKGGRNTEFLLSLALSCEGLDGFVALAADTDGIDGSETNAGAFVDGTTCARLRALGFDPAEMLARHDAWSAFDALGDLFETGPTGTNVNDFRAILIR